MTSPPAARQRHWAQINEVSFVAGMRLLFWIFRLFGRWPFRAVLYPILLWYLLARPAARAASADFLRRAEAHGGAFGQPGGKPSVLRHFAAFGECILDKMLLWGGLFPTAEVACRGGDALDADIARRAGGLIICAHFGNLELSRVLARQRRDVKMTVLVHTKHAQKFNRLLAQLDPASQLNLLQVTEISPATAMLLNERVARGEFVVIAGDRVPVSTGPRVSTARFLGQKAAFPVGPYVLASLLQCPVYLMFCMQAGGRHQIHFERFREMVRLPRKTREEAFSVLVQDFAGRLEHFCLRAPYQWFNFYDFWHLPEPDLNDASR